MVLSATIVHAAGFFTDGDLDVLFVGGDCGRSQRAAGDLIITAKELSCYRWSSTVLRLTTVTLTIRS